MGSLVNAIAIILGSILGLLLKKGIKANIQEAIYKVIGIAVLFIGINGVLSNMAIVTEGVLTTNGEIVLIISLVLGTLIGEVVDIDKHLNQCASAIETKFKLEGFANSFVIATLIFCVGAMAIIGAINDGLLHDPNVLYIKSILDGITSVILASTLGIGVLFSSIPVLIYQGSITLLAGLLSTVLVGDFLRQLCMVGYVLVFCLGFNFLMPTKLKVANMLPSLVIVILYHVVLMII